MTDPAVPRAAPTAEAPGAGALEWGPTLPEVLARAHGTLAVGATLRTTIRAPDGTDASVVGDVVVGGGFALDALHRVEGGFAVEVRRLRTLADTVGPGMRLLVCGLNPSVYAADVGVGFARPGNRFWPAAIAAGLVTADRDPFAALHAGVGMTDLVKRATPRADALEPEEYAAGLGRVGRLVRWLRPGVTCFVGLAGWRAAVDRRARAGPIDGGFGGRPAWLMPSTSGANAASGLDDLVAHLARAAGESAGGRTGPLR